MQATKDIEAGTHHHGVSQFPTEVADEERQLADFEKLNTENTLKDWEKSSTDRYCPKRPHGPLHAQTGVSVERAEADFAELSKQFSNASQQNLRLSRKASRRSDSNEEDVEKTGASFAESEVEPFDLEQTLRGYREQDAQHGIKSKRIGVIWENLNVAGVGGEKSIIRTFPDAFTSFFNLPGTLFNLIGWGKKSKQDFKILQDFRGLAKPGEMVLVLGR